jgi:hypothetical protein
MTKAQLLERMRAHPYAVQSSISSAGHPQSAVVGVAISNQWEIVFDTLSTSRKCANLRRRPEAAVVLGSLAFGASWSIQIEGVADEPSGADRDRLVALYLSVFPDGVDRQQWPGLTYFRIRPQWLRWSDYGAEPPEILELAAAALDQFP